MDDWVRDLKRGMKSGDPLERDFDVAPEEIQGINQVAGTYPMRIPAYYAGLIKEKGDVIWKQAVADPAELEDESGIEDPLNEEGMSPVPHLTHRYPDRVLFLVTSICPMYCRFCTRKRLVGRDHTITNTTIRQGIEYIRQHPEIRDVLISGGDPLVLSDEKLEWILSSLRAIPHLEILRIGTKVPCVLPSRITPELCDMLRKYHPLYMNVHFNHPDELTHEATRSLTLLADAGIPLGSQTVLLKGINDDPEIMKKLFHKLLMARVKPYYLYQADLTTGTNHFRTRVEVGLKIIQALRGFTTGFAVPQFVIDAPGGGGKIAILPDSVVEWNDNEIVLRNFEGKLFRYPQPGEVPAESELAYIDM